MASIGSYLLTMTVVVAVLSVPTVILGVYGAVRTFFADRLVPPKVPPLAHFTSAKNRQEILDSEIIRCRGGIYATHRALRFQKSPWVRSACLLVGPWHTRAWVNIPIAVRFKFTRTRPVGIYTLFKRLQNHHYVTFRKLDLKTMVFHRKDRLMVWELYFLDVCVYLIFILTCVLWWFVAVQS